MTVQGVDRVSFVQEWEDWHRQKEAVLAGPHGFLAITSLHWLSAEPGRFQDAPGAWSNTTDGVVVQLDEGEELTTYAANRALQIAAPDGEGRVTIDFNRAGNLPCAYTDLATCPLPPAGNRLPVAIEAGERIPLERGGQP